MLRHLGADLTVDTLAAGLPAERVVRDLHTAGLILSDGPVVQFFESVNGHRTSATPVLPGMNLLSLPQMLDVRHHMLSVAALPPGHGYPRHAGWPALGFIPEFVPLSRGDHETLVVDLRSGTQRGQVLKFDDALADVAAASWPTLGSYLEEITLSVLHGHPFGAWSPLIRDGVLSWQPNSA